MNQLRLYLLGQFKIERDARPVRLPTRKSEALLAFLVLHPAWHTRDQLTALFWGDFPEAQARTSFRVALSVLRKNLGAGLLLTDQDSVQLNPAYPLWVDALDFERQARAWLADPAPNLSSGSAGEYPGDLLPALSDDWVSPLRQMYRDLYLSVLSSLAERLRTNSEYERAIAVSQQVLATDVANEAAYRNLIFCYAALGDRAAALKQYANCVSRLREELDVEPAPETTALYDWIKQSSATSRAAGSLLSNLPIPLTSLIGRQTDLSQVRRLLAQTRLLTLTGAGGCGKTRLAIQAGTEFVATRAFADGVWWAELAGLTEPALVPQAVAKALGVREEPHQALWETLARHLESKRLLLVLDNCEHVLETCVPLAAQLLSACPDLKVLATSRAALGILGETRYRVPSFTLPDAEATSSMADLARYDGVRLFSERAARLDPDWKLTEQNAAAVAQICRRLDGIPLAIELAAAWAAVLRPEQIAARMDDRFRFLTSGSRSAPPRHQTLRATMDWSYGLLEPYEQSVCRRLAIFAGGFTLEAAEFALAPVPITEHSVGGRESQPTVLGALARLVEHSLVITEPHDDHTRYRQLETIRQYGHERLREAGEEASARQRHLSFFLQMARVADPQLPGAAQAVWLNRLDADLDNLRAALDWSLSSERRSAGDDPAALGLELAAALGQFWYMRGYFGEGRQWLARAVESAQPADQWPALRAEALYWQGFIAWMQADYSAARELFEASRIIAEELGDKKGLARALQNQGLVLTRQGDHAAARELLARSAALQRELGDHMGLMVSLFAAGRVAWFQDDLSGAHALLEQGLALAQVTQNNFLRALALSTLGDVAWSEGDYATAGARLEESLAIFRQVGNRQNIATALVSLGYVAWAQGDYARARAHYAESLAAYRDLGDKWGLANALDGLACLAMREEEPERAARLFGAARHLRDVFGGPEPIFRAAYDRQLALTRAALGEEPFAKAWAAGSARSVEQAIATVLTDF